MWVVTADVVNGAKRIVLQFRKRKRVGGTPSSSDGPRQARFSPAVLHHIDFEMMLKGSVYERKSGSVRQYAVTVNGSTRVITSGETVDTPTYDALLKAGAIRAADVAEAVSPEEDSAENPGAQEGQ